MIREEGKVPFSASWKDGPQAPKHPGLQFLEVMRVTLSSMLCCSAWQVSLDWRVTCCSCPCSTCAAPPCTTPRTCHGAQPTYTYSMRVLTEGWGSLAAYRSLQSHYLYTISHAWMRLLDDQRPHDSVPPSACPIGCTGALRHALFGFCVPYYHWPMEQPSPPPPPSIASRSTYVRPTYTYPHRHSPTSCSVGGTEPHTPACESRITGGAFRRAAGGAGIPVRVLPADAARRLSADARTDSGPPGRCHPPVHARHAGEVRVRCRSRMRGLRCCGSDCKVQRRFSDPPS